MPSGQMASQPFVLGTNTFSQAQRKIFQINHGDDLSNVPANMSSFVPAQILHNSQSGPLPGIV